MGADIKEFFVNERGLTEDTLDAFGLVFPGDGSVHLPYTSGVKGRRHDADGSRHFWFVEGNAGGLFLSPPADGADLCFIVEGETDAMRLWQELGGTFPVAAISGTNGWNDSNVEVFDGFDTVYVILDNDEDYKVSATVDSAWRAIRSALGRRAVRLQLSNLPIKVKDLCEFFDNFDIDVLRQLADEVPQTGEYYRNLDLTKPAPPTDWLVRGLIAKGDVTMWAGEPEVGKSMLTMDLATAVTNGRDHFLGRDVLHQGRVLYIDEENPEDVVRQRLEKFGLNGGAENLRYIHHQSVRLDKHPERLIEEAQDFAPELIIVDSLTRIHTGDENSAGFIAQLFNDGINPLVRETGAAMVLLHHVNKSEGTSSFGRVRGSSDITGSIDAGYDLAKVGQHIHIKNFKSRRARSGGMIVAEIVDTPDDRLEIVTRQRTVF